MYATVRVFQQENHFQPAQAEYRTYHRESKRLDEVQNSLRHLEHLPERHAERDKVVVLQADGEIPPGQEQEPEREGNVSRSVRSVPSPRQSQAAQAVRQDNRDQVLPDGPDAQTVDDLRAFFYDHE